MVYILRIFRSRSAALFILLAHFLSWFLNNNQQFSMLASGDWAADHNILWILFNFNFVIQHGSSTMYWCIVILKDKGILWKTSALILPLTIVKVPSPFQQIHPHIIGLILAPRPGLMHCSIHSSPRSLPHIYTVILSNDHFTFFPMSFPPSPCHSPFYDNLPDT